MTSPWVTVSTVAFNWLRALSCTTLPLIAGRRRRDLLGDDHLGRLDDQHDGIAGGLVELGVRVLGDGCGARLAIVGYGHDGLHYFPVVDRRDHAVQWVAGAELHVGPAGCQVTRRVEGLIEEPADSSRALPAPHVDEVIVDVA